MKPRKLFRLRWIKSRVYFCKPFIVKSATQRGTGLFLPWFDFPVLPAAASYTRETPSRVMCYYPGQNRCIASHQLHVTPTLNNRPTLPPFPPSSGPIMRVLHVERLMGVFRPGDLTAAEIPAFEGVRRRRIGSAGGGENRQRGQTGARFSVLQRVSSLLCAVHGIQTLPGLPHREPNYYYFCDCCRSLTEPKPFQYLFEVTPRIWKVLLSLFVLFRYEEFHIL